MSAQLDRKGGGPSLEFLGRKLEEQSAKSVFNFDFRGLKTGFRKAFQGRPLIRICDDPVDLGMFRHSYSNVLIIAEKSSPPCPASAKAW